MPIVKFKNFFSPEEVCRFIEELIVKGWRVIDIVCQDTNINGKKFYIFYEEIYTKKEETKKQL